MIINKNEELTVLQMYNDVCSENKETLDMIHLAERIIKKRKKWCERCKVAYIEVLRKCRRN